MTITVTSIKLNSVWGFFRLSYMAMKIVLQLKKQKGFIKYKNKGFGYLHYTLSAWESEAEMKQFVPTGAHREAMKASAAIATEIRTHTFESDEMPSWKEAKQLLIEKGKLLTFN
jgi:hypothetical protein